jgi:mannose-6-phosphate isomerase-like protein (cupin superfamily)
VQSRNVKQYVHFSPEDVRRETVFETANLWTEVLCFDRNQTLGPMTDDVSDAVFTIVAGEGVFVVDGRRKRLEQWATVLVPSGAQVTVTNASADPLVVLLMTAPPASSAAK